jgi:hypothetical protein
VKNKILKAGDFVKYHKENEDLTLLGLEVGKIYEIGSHKEKELSKARFAIITNFGYRIELVDDAGELTEFSDYFVKHQCPITLPKGASNETNVQTN